MKTAQVFRIILVLCLLNFVSCSKDSVDDNDKSDTTTANYGKMTAKVTGLNTIEDNTRIVFYTPPIKKQGDRIWG